MKKRLNTILLNIRTLNLVGDMRAGSGGSGGSGGGGSAPEGYMVYRTADGSPYITADGERYCVKI